MQGNDPRRKRLRTFFHKIISGEQLVNGIQNAKLFVEATCDQEDAVACVQRLISSSNGLKAAQMALQVDVSPKFFNSTAVSFLKYLQAPELAVVSGGGFLHRLLLAIVDPPILWTPLVDDQRYGRLNSSGLHSFAWLLLQLLNIPDNSNSTYLDVARDPRTMKQILESSEPSVRIIGEKIKQVLETLSQPSKSQQNGPGGRHNNDFEDFRKISVVPTIDELESKDLPFFRRAVEIEESSASERPAMHLDNQFRLLREDMVRSLREDLEVALDLKKGRFKGQKISGLCLDGITCNNRNPWSLRLRCSQDLHPLPRKSVDQRKKFLKDNRKFLPHETLACLLVDDRKLVAIVTLDRDEELLALDPPVLSVRFCAHSTPNSRALIELKSAEKIHFVQLNTALFAYEPVLRQLQRMKVISLKDEILNWNTNQQLHRISLSRQCILEELIANLESDPSFDISDVLRLKKKVRLDHSQARSLIAGVTQRLSLIQGPPGTGKSFIGALIAKLVYLFSSQKILVVCYTNHALNQFTEDLIEIGIPLQDIVRLGSPSKASIRTQALALSNLTRRSDVYRLTKLDYEVIDHRKAESMRYSERLQAAFDKYGAKRTSKDELLEHLQFEHSDFFDAFQVPDAEHEMTRVDRRGRAVGKHYLVDQWCQGRDAGIFKREVEHRHPEIWRYELSVRQNLLTSWKREIVVERASTLCDDGMMYDQSLSEVKALFSEKDRRILQNKRIIACTTTGAAKYVQEIQSASPGILLVEEAGEILESHILTALGPETQQLVLIGDHKQLRPKAHHDLSVEKGEGYDLNRSLFERLVLKGYPHGTLTEQHRMRPEISALVRQMTYPDLKDAATTANRPNLRGFTDNLMFISHQSPEEQSQAPDWRDGASSASKKNKFEAEMTLKCVKYLAQQGYRTDQVVVLTPYVAQLRLLFDVLATENDPVLNDMDSYDLVRAGLMPAATARSEKRQLRISTIDNYQGEECDIVLISLTRSNLRGDIGFLSSPERLNVLLSRARDALILIGNATMFAGIHRSDDLWPKFLRMLKEGSHIYDGFPVKCESHPERRAILCSPKQFDEHCPDGGCDEPCKATLSCKLHICPQLCHQLFDHSNVKCRHLMGETCSSGHKLKWVCANGKPKQCLKCEQDRKATERRILAEIEQQEELDRQTKEHATKIALLDAELAQVKKEIARSNLSKDMSVALEQKKRDVEEAKKLAASQIVSKGLTKTSHATAAAKTDDIVEGGGPKGSQQAHRSLPQDSKIDSKAEEEWERQKRVDDISIDAIDSLMRMTGLKQVKEQFLKIKSRIDTSQRQNTDLKQERFGIVLLGNPGTGKTTVARLYAKFLTSTGVIPGTEFFETTGSRLASEGVAGAKKHLDTITSAGGGAFFLDEAYQLALSHNHGGAAVLDFLLAEIENLAGKVIFIFAGYEKQMEKFFEHNQGFESRMPYRLKFADYNDQELALMLSRAIEKKYAGNMKVEGGLSGLYIRIAARRVGRNRGREGFGNARALENLLSRISERQSDRLQRERVAGTQPSDFEFTKEDLIGPDPSSAILESHSWTKLQSMIGLDNVKDAIHNFLSRVETNYRRELDEKPLVEVSLNRLFIGSPGTGKTTVAKLYGQILADLGLLSSSEVIVKDPSDFIGSVVGESEKTTKAILKSTEGKVLLIDEAYMLGSGSGSNNPSDPFRTAVVDTLVSGIQSAPGEDRCVLLLGYLDQMEAMFQNVNPGLARRFPLESAFTFEDYNNEQLLQILNFKLNDQGLEANPKAKKVAIDVLAKARRKPNFGNAGEVENLISRAKDSHQKRTSRLPPSDRSAEIVFEPQDFDSNFDRGSEAMVNCQALFKDVVGCDEIVGKIEGMIRSVQTMRLRNVNPEEFIPFNFIFKGPPGTGKTTTARKMGQIYYDMGFLASTEVQECSATDLVGEYVGQTGPKTVQLLTKALGKVLFIDEAYRLGEGHFAKEAIDELVDSLTKPKFKGKMIVILAGYDNDMNKLLSVNSGLSSRFPEEFTFRNLDSSACIDLLWQELAKTNLPLADPNSRPASSELIKDLFEELIALPSFGNGRDIQTLATRITRSFYGAVESQDLNSTLNPEDVIQHITSLLKERRSRAPVQLGGLSAMEDLDLFAQAQAHQQTPTTRVASKTGVTTDEVELQSNNSTTTAEEPSSARDDGVSDAIWLELEVAKAEEEKFRVTAENSITRAANESQALQSDVEKLAEELQALEVSTHSHTQDDDGANERKRQHEMLRLKILADRQKARDAGEKLRLAREMAEQKRKEEAKVQQKLRQMGVCCAGFQWHKVAGGYRCAGGSHWVTDAALGI